MELRIPLRQDSLMKNGAPNPFKARFTTVKKEAVPVIMTRINPIIVGTGNSNPGQLRWVFNASTIGTPNAKPNPKCTKVVVQTAWLFVWCRSRIFLPNQTRGNVNNTPPTMIEKYTTFENDAFSTNHQIIRIIAKRKSLKNVSTICFIITSFLIIGYNIICVQRM